MEFFHCFSETRKLSHHPGTFFHLWFFVVGVNYFNIPCTCAEQAHFTKHPSCIWINWEPSTRMESFPAANACSLLVSEALFTFQSSQQYFFFLLHWPVKSNISVTLHHWTIPCNSVEAFSILKSVPHVVRLWYFKTLWEKTKVSHHPM